LDSWWILDVGQEEPEIQRGVHYHCLESDLSQAKTRQVLAVLQSPEILDALTRRPIQEIIIRRLADKSTSAFYVYADQSITVNSARKLGVHFGEEFRPGITINMSAATPDKMESMRRALLQETAHHMEGLGGAHELMRRGLENPNKRPITQYAADAGWREYFAESFVAYFTDPSALENYDPAGSMMVKRVLSVVRK
jgi:hypothetical protein